MTLFLAGHETTALATGFSWYLLAQHPQYFARLRAEGLPFALQVLKESMRLYPPAYGLARSAVRDTMIGGFPIKEGELVFAAQWLLHRDPRYFEEPMRFDPGSVSAGAGALIPKYAYFPFSGGKRNCIGNHFALAEGRIILDTLAKRFAMELVSRKPIKFQPLITLRPKGGIRVKLRAAS